jgi:hypothetical protein
VAFFVSNQLFLRPSAVEGGSDSGFHEVIAVGYVSHEPGDIIDFALGRAVDNNDDRRCPIDRRPL